MSLGTAPSPSILFGDAPDTAAKFAEMTEKLDACLEAGLRAKMTGEAEFVKGRGIVKSAQAQAIDTLTKSISGDQLAAVQSALATADTAKTNGWTLTNPLNVVPFGAQGLVPYNLSPVLQMLVPRELKLRNSVPRIKGVGEALNFRSITGVSNSASGGVSNFNTFFSSASTSATIGGLALNRPGLIQYAATSYTLPYAESGVSDYVTMQAEFAGQGYTSLRSLSAMATLWSTLLGDERNYLGGVVNTTTVGSAAAVAAADASVSGTPLPGATATAVYVTFTSGAVAAGATGESKAITATGTVTTTAGQGIKLTSLTNVPAGTVAVNIYANYSGTYYKGTTVIAANGASPATWATVAALPSTSVDNGSNTPNGYDGFISVLTNSSLTGYSNAVNGALSTTSPTTEFQSAFQSLYTSIAADPDVIYTTPSIRKAVAASLQSSGGSSTGFRITYEGGNEGIGVGSFVNGVVNEVTGKMVALETHRYMPAGVALIVSNQVPFPDSGVANAWEFHNVADTIILEWPQIDLNYAMSSYTYGVLAYRAPAFSGILTGINN